MRYAIEIKKSSVVKTFLIKYVAYRLISAIYDTYHFPFNVLYRLPLQPTQKAIIE